MKPFFFRAPDDDAQGASGGNTPKTDNTQLVTVGAASVTTDEAGTNGMPFPVPAVDYYFCVVVANKGTLNSGAFYVRFSLDDGSGNAPQTFDSQQGGLDGGQNVNATAHFGSFADTDTNYNLKACIFSAASPDTPINCVNDNFGFNPHLNSQSSGSTAPDTTQAPDNGDDTSNTTPPANSGDTSNAPADDSSGS